MRTLLLGMGNPILGDDAIGVRLARDLAARLDGTPGLEAVPECSTGGLDVLDLLAGYERVIVIDSIRTAEGVPGTWSRFTAARLRDTLHLRNVHDVNFATALALGRRTGMPLAADDDIHIFAVEIAEASTFGEALSPALEALYPEIRADLFGAIRALLAGSAP
jgi:hydrogenase maturation protease